MSGVRRSISCPTFFPETSYLLILSNDYVSRCSCCDVIKFVSLIHTTLFSFPLVQLHCFGLLQMCLDLKRSFLDDFYCMYPRRPPTSPQANPCVPHTCGAWKGIPEHPWVGGGRIETNKDGLVGVFRLGTGVAAMAGGVRAKYVTLRGH